MANATKLLNNLNPAGENLIFYTELDSDLEVGDRVFIIGGNYNNTVYTDDTHELYDPFNPYAVGYIVLGVDKTNVSNAITLNIPYRNAQFNTTGFETTIFSPLNVYKTEEELLIEPNQTREAWISKSYFKSGEFNGGEFQDGIFGEYNIKGDISIRQYERQHFVNLLINEIKDDVNRQNDYQKLITTDYSLLESPSVNNKSIFNNNYQNIAAKFTGGVFLGGEFQWGSWESKYNDNKNGKKQTLADDGGLKDPLDQSKFNIELFDNNNNGFGYSILSSGNVGRIYKSKDKHNIKFIQNDQKIQIDYLPYELKKALNFNFKLQIRIHSEKNNKIFDIAGIEIITNSLGVFNFIILEDIQRYNLLENGEQYDIKQLIFDEDGLYHVELMVKDSQNQPNKFNKGRLQNVDWFSGLISEAHIQGGDFHYGEFQLGLISSLYSRMYWNDGIFNGLKDFSIAEDLRWGKGKFLDGNWKGDINISIKRQNIENNTLTLVIKNEYKHLLQIGEDIFVSYLKTNSTNKYISNFTDQPNINLINFQSFKLLNIVENEETKAKNEVILELEGFVDLQTDINLQYAKISQSNFNKGHWKDGIWETGLRKVLNYKVENFDASTSFINNNKILFYLNNVDNLEYGEQIHVSNLQFIREIDIDLIPDLIVDDRNNVEFYESFDSFLTILEIDKVNNTLLAMFPPLDDIESDDNISDGRLIDIREIQNINKKTELSPNIWENGIFNSGAWRGGIWKDGFFKSFLYFEQNNTNIQSIWQTGYWKNGTWDNAAFLSGVWQNGLFIKGVMTNLYNNVDNNDNINWDFGDSVWVNGTINGGTWRRGLFLNGINNGATIINGGIENIDWKNGVYSNGLSQFNNSINSNKSGRLTDSNKYTNLSAPSMIYIDGDGWVQLDQNSFYQKDYNIIFQDLDIWDNPFNNQMFNILNRDKYGSKLLINYNTSNNIDNPLMLLDEFQQNRPILIIDNISDICEVEKTDTNHRIWVCDSGHQRILEVDQITNKVDVLGLILNDQSKNIFDFSDLKFVACANKSNSVWVYVVDGLTVKLINKEKNNIITFTPNFNATEEIVDIQVVSTNENLPETVLLITNENNIYYFITGFDNFKFLSTSVVGTESSISILRGDTTNSINLFIKYLNSSNVYTIQHFVLDYNISLQTYNIRLPLPSNISNLDALIGENKIVTFTSKFESNFVKFWIILEDSNLEQKAYKFNYRTFFTGNQNEYFLLNENPLNFRLNRLKMGFDNEYLQLIGLDNVYSQPLLFAKAELEKISTGFGDTKSTVKLLNIFQNLEIIENASTSSTSSIVDIDYTYWYYDLSNQTNRIVYIDETIDNLFDPELDIDTIEEANHRVLKMVPGSNSSEIYSIVIDDSTSQYFIRKTNSSKKDTQNSTLYTLTNINKIYDIVFNKNKLFLFVEDNNNLNRLVALENFAGSNQDITNLGYSSNISNITGTNFKLDVIENGINFVAILWSNENKLYEYRIDSTDYDYIEIFDNVFNVEDIALTKTHNNTQNSLFIATLNNIVRIVSDVEVVSGSLTHFRWSEINNTDTIYTGSNIKEVYRNSLGDKIIVKTGTRFDYFESDYITNEFIIDEVVVNSDGQSYGISQNRLIKFGVSGTNFEVVRDSNNNEIGIYKQKSRIKHFDLSEIGLDTDHLMGDVYSLILAEDFGSEDYLFWIENTEVSNQSAIRYYTISSQISGVSTPTIDFTDRNFTALTYDKTNRRVYYVENNVTSQQIGYFDFNAVGLYNDNIVDSIVSSINIVDISYMFIGGNEYLTLLKSDTSIDLYNITTTNISTIVAISNIPFNNVTIDTDGSNTTLYYNEKNSVVRFITTTQTTQTGLFNTSNWTDESSISEFSNVIHLTDYRPVNNLTAFGGDKALVYDLDDNQITLFENDVVNEDIVNLTALSIVNFSLNDDIFFVYNNPNTSSPSGVIRQEKTSNSNISIFIDNQLDDITTSTFKKLVALNNNIAYVLFEDGIYRYNFTTNSVTNIGSPILEYRDITETNPIDISNYKAVAVDMTIFDLNGTPTLLVLYEIYTPANNATNHYDVFLYNGVSYTKNNITHLYGSINSEIGNDAIDSNGNIDTIRLSDSPPNFGGIKHLFKSGIEPKIFSKNNSVYLYFDNPTVQFLRISSTSIIEVVENSQFGDLKLKITLTDFNKTEELLSTNSVTIYPDPTLSPLDNSVGLSSNSIDLTYSVGTETIVDATDYNSFVATFNKGAGTNWVSTDSYSCIVKTTIGASQIPVFGSVLDFIVYNENSGSGDYDQLVIRESSSGNAITTYTNFDTYWELNKTGTGIWEIDDIISTNDKTLFGPSSADITLQLQVLESENDNNIVSIFFEQLLELIEKYDFDIWNRGYKVITPYNQTLSPYLTARVLYNTILHENVSFNNGGTPFTAHVVNTRWKSGLFLGSWDTPFYFDHSIKKGFSVFLDGIFEGNFYDGFFLGGIFRNNSNFNSIVSQGHFSSDNKNIDFLSGSINSLYRHDILDIKWENNKLKIKTEGLKFENGNYRNVIISNITKGTWVRIPNLFKKVEIEIDEIIKGSIEVKGYEEIIIKGKKPEIFNEELFLNQDIFIQAFEYSEYLFGNFNVENVFINDDFIYLTIRSEFNEFIDGIYEPIIKPKIIFNVYNQVTDSNTFYDNIENKWFTTFEFDLLVPSTISTEINKLTFIQDRYILENYQVLNEGDFQNYILIPDYLQIFNFTFTKTEYELLAFMQSELMNAYIQDVISDFNLSRMEIELSNNESSLFAHDIMVSNSYITTPQIRINDYLSNNIFLSGKTDRKWLTGAWLNLDDKGFSNGVSQFGAIQETNDILDVEIQFNGEFSKIKNIFFEGENYIWVELDTILFDIDKYRYLTLRGFTGNKSKLIGAETSNVFRIVDIDNNFIKIKNPFKLYSGITPKDYFNNFNMDQLQIRSQTMSIFNSDVGIEGGAFYNVSELDILYGTVWREYAGLENSKPGRLLTGPYLGGFPKIDDETYYQIMNELEPNSGEILRGVVNGGGFNGVAMFHFLEYGTQDPSTIPNSPTQYENYRFGQELLLSLILKKSIKFDYGYASPSSWNGGDFYGEMNSIWNAGTFKNGTFNGLWFGSTESYGWEGIVNLNTENLGNKYLLTLDLNNVSVQEDDLIYVKFSSIFFEGVLKNILPGFYSNVIDINNGTSSTNIVVQTEINDYIEPGLYSINLIRYRTGNIVNNNSNYLIVDYNTNIASSNDVDDHLILDYNLTSNSTTGNYVIDFSGVNDSISTIDLINIANRENINNQFTIDLYFNYDNTITKQPILSFIDSKTTIFGGFKLYVLNNNLTLEYNSTINIDEKIILYNNLTNDIWYHIAIFYSDNTLKVRLNNSNEKTFNINLDLLIHDINFIAKDLFLNFNEQIDSIFFSGKMDEIRIWNKNIYNEFISGDFWNKKFINRRISELTAYYSGDGQLDLSNIYPEEEQYLQFNEFLPLSNDPILITNDNGEDFIYNGDNLFYEIDFFADKSILNNDGIYKILTIEEIRNISDSTDPTRTAKYYLELLLIDSNNSTSGFAYPPNSFVLELRERSTITDQTKNNLMYYDQTLIIDTIDNSVFGNFWKWQNIILNDNSLFLNGEKVGNFNLFNRNLFKHTINTKVYLGYYEYSSLTINLDVIEKTPGFIGFVKNVNIWRNINAKDEYIIYRILSGENTDILSIGDITDVNDTIENVNNNIKSVDPSTFVIPYFNEDGSQIWEHFIYTSENYVDNGNVKLDTNNLTSGSGIDEFSDDLKFINTDLLNNALPEDSWLEGSDFIELYHTISQGELVGNIEIDNMDNFKFFGKKFNQNGKTSIKILSSGYIFFENIIPSIPLLYPRDRYIDLDGETEYNQTSTTDAIFINNTVFDARNGKIEYADRQNEFILKYYGVTNFNGKTDDDDTVPPDYTNDELFSFFVLRIDKINSNILIYTRRLNGSNNNKYQGLRRSDKTWNYINDFNNLSYHKIPETTASEPNYSGDIDYVIGHTGDQNGTNSANNTEYVLYIPRFELKDKDDSFVEFIKNEDYDNLKLTYNIEIAKQFNGKNIVQYNLIQEDIGIVPYYLKSLSNIEAFDINNFKNVQYNLSEQFTNIQLETDVARVSFFENGIFNADYWHNGIFVNGLVNSDDFIWKYGIKHNGRVQGGENVNNYAHWLGGFHLGETENSYLRNIVWYRGYFNSGQWEKGNWLALDLENNYINSSSGLANDNWSILEGGEWYSKTFDLFTDKQPVVNNLILNNDFSFGYQNWGLFIKPITTPNTWTIQKNNGAIIELNQIGDTGYISQSISSKFKLNNEYRVRLEVENSNIDIINQLTIEFTDVESAFTTIFATPTLENTLSENTNIEIVGTLLKIDLNKNSQIIDFIVTLDSTSDTIDVFRISKIFNIGSVTGSTTIIKNITISPYNPNIYDYSNHESIWHGGIWRSSVIEGFNYTYENNIFDNYVVKNDNILQLPKVNSIWLGGLWLRGQFEGGIFANGFWNSISEELAFSGDFGSSGLYEEQIKFKYDETFSSWQKGMMINSIWEGGIVEDNLSKLETIFGDLLNLFSLQNIQNDFVWDNEFGLKRSDSSQSYTTIFGKDMFIGYNNETDVSIDRGLVGENIQLERVIEQFTNDGVMSVYWKRGIFNNGIFQFSHWSNQTLDKVDNNIITKNSINVNSTFNSGLIYHSFWDGGLFNAEPTNDEYPLLFETNEPNSIFYRSQWKKGYWKVSDNGLDTDDTDDIRICDALFSRSIWSSGVFEGGIMDLSVWRSGVTENCNIEYYNDIIQLNVADIDDLTLALPNGTIIPEYTDFSDTSQISSLKNGTNFLSSLENSNLRLMGNVDNFASIWVNGCMKASIWHGGVWQRGMFSHRDFINGDLDFFDDIVTNNDTFQVGVFLRGMWLSGYFSFYNDRNIDYGQLDQGLSYGDNNEHLLEDEKFRRCLFMGVKAGDATENNNIFGLTETLLESIKIDISTNPTTSIHNYSSLFSRKLIKETTTNLTALKHYWCQLNGSMINGLLYDSAVSPIADKRFILSLFASVSDMYLSTKNNNSVTQLSLTYFQEKIKITQNSDYFIPYSIISPLYYNGSWLEIAFSEIISISYLSGIWNNQSRFQWKTLNIWRHNNGSQSTSGNSIGDGTIVNGTNGLPYVEFDGDLVQVSIAQGCGLEWIPNEPFGEPRHTADIGDDENGFVGKTADFDFCEFDGGTNGIGGDFDVGGIPCP